MSLLLPMRLCSRGDRGHGGGGGSGDGSSSVGSGRWDRGGGCGRGRTGSGSDRAQLAARVWVGGEVCGAGLGLAGVTGHGIGAGHGDEQTARFAREDRKGKGIERGQVGKMHIVDMLHQKMLVARGRLVLSVGARDRKSVV